LELIWDLLFGIWDFEGVMDLQEIGEFGLLSRVRQWMAVSRQDLIQGIGDDVAVIESGSKVLLATTDLLIEGVHFERSWIDPYRLGKKSLMVNLSDIAAMGGIPTYFLLSLGLPKDLPLSFVSRFYRGLKDGAKQYGVALIGGDTSVSQKIVINICLLGEGKKDEIVYRKGARIGDDLYVSGMLGESALGLRMLQDKSLKKKSKWLIERHLSPRPMLGLGWFLGQSRWATAMIDVSDGLLIDAGHLLEESRVGGRIWKGCVPRSNLLLRYAPLYSEDPYQLSLCGGEDYELLFTAPPLPSAVKDKIFLEAALHGGIVTHIGYVVSRRKGFRIIDNDGKEYPPDCLGFEHFK
jgi:thiamine-monophosphate kinase